MHAIAEWVGTPPAKAASRWQLEAASFLAQKTENTRASYAVAIRDFFAFAGVEPPAVSTAHLTAYARSLEAKGNSNGTVSARLVALSSFFRHLQRCRSASEGGLVAHNPVASMDRSRWKATAWKSTRTMDPADLWRILGHLEERGTVVAKRDRALLLFYALTGRRRREVLGLRGGDFEQRGGWVAYRYHNSKSKRSKRRELHPEVVAAVEDYLAASARPPLCELEEGSPVWLCHSGRTVGQPFQRVDWALKQRAKQAGVSPDRVHVHGLRHLFATTRNRAGEPVLETSQQLDHSSLAVTQGYLHSIVGERDTFGSKAWDALREGA